jgi:hypothetical protein
VKESQADEVINFIFFPLMTLIGADDLQFNQR